MDATPRVPLQACEEGVEMNCDERTTAGVETEEIYNPVKCCECNTEVGVYDKDELFHFFNVLASYT